MGMGQPLSLSSIHSGPMRAQHVQVMVRFTGHTFQVPLWARSGRPGNSLRSDSPGRFSCAGPSGTKNGGQWCPGRVAAQPTGEDGPWPERTV